MQSLLNAYARVSHAWLFFVTDINECGIVTSNNCSTSTSICKNKDGGYVCECKSGFTQKNLYECEGKCHLDKSVYKCFMTLDMHVT